MFPVIWSSVHLFPPKFFLQGHFGVFSLQIYVAEVAAQTALQGDDVVLYYAVAPFLNIDIAETRAKWGCLFYFVDVEMNVCFADDFHDLCGEEMG